MAFEAGAKPSPNRTATGIIHPRHVVATLSIALQNRHTMSMSFVVSSASSIISPVADSAIQRWRSKKSTRESSPDPSLDFMPSYSSVGLTTKLEVGTWLLDVASNRSMEFLPSADWLVAKMKTTKKYQDVWSRFAKLTPHFRNSILAFLEIRRHFTNSEWTLYHFEFPQKRSRTKLFGQKRDDHLIQLILCRPRVDDENGDMPRSSPKIEGPGNGLPKRVSFAEELGEKSGTEKGAHAASDHVLPRTSLDLRERISKLEEKRSRLGVHDQERIEDLNDMLAYLRDQLKSDATHINALSTTAFHGELQPNHLRPSESIRAPTIIYDENVPDRSRRDSIIGLNDRFERRPSPSRRPSDADDIDINGSYPRFTHDTFGTVMTEGSRGRPEYGGRHSSGRYRHHEPRERRRNCRAEEDMIVVHRDHDRSSQRGWQDRSRSRSRFSRQGTQSVPFVLESRDRSWERSKPRMYSRQARQSSMETDHYDQLNRRMVGDDDITSSEKARQRDGEVGSPERQEIVIRERSKSRPREGQILSDSGSEYTYSGCRVRRGPSMVDEPAQSQALVLRAGASGLYSREHVSNGGIRVRGDDDIGSSHSVSVMSQHVRRPSRPPTSRRSSYGDRSWAPSLRRRLSETLHQPHSSEDEECRYPDVSRVDSEKNGSETELKDAEVIAQTLKKYTTIQENDVPATGIAVPPIHKKRAPEAIAGPSPLINVWQPSPVLERKNSLPVPGRKAHFEQEAGLPQRDQNGQSRAINGGSKSVEEGPFLGKISEEPDAMNEDDRTPHHQHFVYFPERSILPRPQQRPFPFLPDLAHQSREASPRSQSRNSNLDSPRVKPANEPIILENDGYPSGSGEKAIDHAAQEEGYDEVENIRQISRNPTVQEEVE